MNELEKLLRSTSRNIDRKVQTAARSAAHKAARPARQAVLRGTHSTLNSIFKPLNDLINGKK